MTQLVIQVLNVCNHLTSSLKKERSLWLIAIGEHCLEPSGEIPGRASKITGQFSMFCKFQCSVIRIQIVTVCNCNVRYYVIFFFLFCHFSRSRRDVREFANGSVCLECDAQCEVAEDDGLTCTGPVSFVSACLLGYTL